MSTLAQLLADAGLPRLEAQLLLHMAGGGNRVTQLTWPEREASAEVAQRFAALCARRHAGEPIAYLLGEREFFGLDLAVSLAVALAGGGVKGGLAHGKTDELGFHAVENRHYVTDLHATLLHLFGLDAKKLVFRRNGAEQSLLDGHDGRVVRELLA